MRIALDTNVLAYAEGVNDAVKRDVVTGLLQALSPDTFVIPVQALGELFNILVRKAGKPRHESSQALLGWSDAFVTIPTTPQVISAAIDLATDHHFSIWDALILCAASHAGCRLLLSEDLHDGFTWGGVTVVNPFVTPRHPLLDALLGA